VLFISVDVKGYTATYRDSDSPLSERVIVPLDLAKSPWGHSTWENWTEIMGIHFWEWFIPIPPTAREKWWEFEFNDSTKNYLRTNAREQVDREARQWMINTVNIPQEPEKAQCR
jgi:hypothetical protein